MSAVEACFVLPFGGLGMALPGCSVARRSGFVDAVLFGECVVVGFRRIDMVRLWCYGVGNGCDDAGGGPSVISSSELL